jgi:hypothetical protein
VFSVADMTGPAVQALSEKHMKGGLEMEMNALRTAGQLDQVKGGVHQA